MTAIHNMRLRWLSDHPCVNYFCSGQDHTCSWCPISKGTFTLAQLNFILRMTRHLHIRTVDPRNIAYADAGRGDG